MSGLSKQRRIQLSQMSDGDQRRQQVGRLDIHILLQVLQVVKTNTLTTVKICCKQSTNKCCDEGKAILVSNLLFFCIGQWLIFLLFYYVQLTPSSTKYHCTVHTFYSLHWQTFNTMSQKRFFKRNFIHHSIIIIISHHRNISLQQLYTTAFTKLWWMHTNYK